MHLQFKLKMLKIMLPFLNDLVILEEIKTTMFINRTIIEDIVEVAMVKKMALIMMVIMQINLFVSFVVGLDM